MKLKKGDIILSGGSLDECIDDQKSLDFVCLAVTEKFYNEGSIWSPGAIWFNELINKDVFRCHGKIPIKDLVLYTHWKHKSKRFFELLGQINETKSN